MDKIWRETIAKAAMAVVGAVKWWQLGLFLTMEEVLWRPRRLRVLFGGENAVNQVLDFWLCKPG